MESNQKDKDTRFGVLDKLKNELNHLHNLSISPYEEQESVILKKEYSLLSKIVNCFQEILSDNFIINNGKKQQNSENEKNKKCYWDFISKHFNTPVVGFCKMFEKNDKKEGNSPIQKAKNWIYFSILEKTFLDSINEIFNQELDKIYYGENAIIRKYKSKINKYLEELQQIKFINIKSNDYEKYLEYLQLHPIIKYKNEEKTLEKKLKFEKSPIVDKRKLTVFSADSQKIRNEILSKFGEIIVHKGFFSDNEDEDDDDINNIIIIDDDKEIKNIEKKKDIKFQIKNNEQTKNKENNGNKFKIKKFDDFSPSIVDNFYTFNNQKEKVINHSQSIDLENNISNNNSTNKIFIEEEINSSNHNEELKKHKSDVILNPKMSKHLPTDIFYEEYNQNDNLFFKEKKKPISNSLLLYLTKYNKKAPYHKIYKHNLNQKKISLKDQNYQCYICLKRIHTFLNIPIEPVFLCSYYMKYICKNCIDYEYSIIPHFIYKKWCFDKFPISKKAKNILESWYDKPVIIFNKKNKLLEKIPQLNKVIKITKIIKNMFNLMKCKNKFKIKDEIFGEYDYFLLKEIIFSMKDLVEINNKTFIKKINKYKDRLSLHLSEECLECKFEGQICDKCHNNEKLFFYNKEEVFYCKKCNKSWHKKCLDLIGHIHLNKVF